MTGLLAGALMTAALPTASGETADSPEGVTVPERLLLQYAGPEGCADREAFVDEVSRRISRPVEWVTESPSLSIDVSVLQLGRHAAGELRITRAGSAPSRREFAAASCAEVQSALALVVALTLDPKARTDALEPPRRAKPATVPPRSTEPVKREPSPARVSPNRTKTGEVRSSGWIGPAVSAVAGYAPKSLLLAGATLGFRLRGTRGAFWAPAVELAPLWGQTGTTGPEAQAARFSWAIARLSACPTALSLATQLSLLPCAAGEIGRLSAQGSASAVPAPSNLERWWAAAGVALSLHYASRPWFAEVQLAGLTPITRDRFFYANPDSFVHQAGFFLPSLQVSVGVELGR